MPKPTGDQWVRLYRGFAGTTAEEVSTRRLGVHWTPDFDTAKIWTDPEKHGVGAPPDQGDGTWRGIYDKDTSGTIVSALVHKRHIIPEDSEEWEDVTSRSTHGYSLGFEGEKELTVRPKATVHITGMQTYNPDGKLVETVGYPPSLKNRGRA